MSNEFGFRKAYKGEWLVDVQTGPWIEIVDWCKETFGPPGRNKKFYTWRVSYSPEKYFIYFRNEADVTLFRLRWE